MLKTIAILFNLAFIVFFGYLFLQDPPQIESISDLAPVLLIFLTPIINLIALFLLSKEKEGWFRLFLRRKALEEKQKISELKNKEND